MGTAGVVTLSNVTQGKPPDPRTYIALAALWLLLAFISDVSDELATPVALLIFLSVLLGHGSGWLNALARGVK